MASVICVCGHHEDDHGKDVRGIDGVVTSSNDGCRFCPCDGFEAMERDEDDPDSEFAEPESGVIFD